MGYFKVTNVKIAYISLTVRDKYVVTMKHYWEVDTGLSEFAKKLTSDDLDEVISIVNVMKVKMARIVLSVVIGPCCLRQKCSPLPS